MMYIQVVGMRETLARLYGIDAGLIDLTKPLKETRKYLEGMMKKRFKNRGDAPLKWPPVSETTLRLREVNKNKEPLIDRGNLLRAVSSPTSRYAKHTVFKNRLRFAISETLRNNGAFYPAIVEAGATVKNGWGKGIPIKIPARPYMYINDKNDKEIEKIFKSYMDWLVSKPV